MKYSIVSFFIAATIVLAFPVLGMETESITQEVSPVPPQISQGVASPYANEDNFSDKRRTVYYSKIRAAQALKTNEYSLAAQHFMVAGLHDESEMAQVYFFNAARCYIKTKDYEHGLHTLYIAHKHASKFYSTRHHRVCLVNSIHDFCLWAAQDLRKIEYNRLATLFTKLANLSPFFK